MTNWLSRAVAFYLLIAIAFVPFVFAEPADPASSAAPQSSSAPPEVSPTATAKKNFTDKLSCKACHSTTSWRAKGASGGSQKFDHSQTGFPLTGAHVETPCVGCHNATRTIKRACASCHDDFHRGRLSQSCDRCHSAAGWKLTKPIDLHRLTRLPLTGMHVLADCTECHRRTGEQRFTDAPVACFACHEKDYRRTGIFPVHVGTANTAPLPRDCSLCHRAIAWVPAVAPVAAMGTAASALSIAPADHDVKFPVSFGAHRTATCPDCHASPTVPRAVRCVGCHAHAPAAVMQQHRQPVATSGNACLGCHIAGARR
jgi:hypothetical protein